MHAPLGIPRHVGRYTILRKIGQGGMGAVYEAEQENPRRTVALKVITGPAASSPETLRRFELEVHVLGMLQHPNVAHIFEAGTFEIEGELRPFFAMELVRGVPLLEWADAKKLSTRERLELLARICDALHHAHERGIVHRDLKPSNILVTDEGEPKVLDFGVARATNADVQAVTMRTDVGQLVGTLPYMSPEQASGDPTRIDSRSDVYSLGVVGYQLLSGRMPYDIDRVMLHEGVRIVREVEARPLSSVARSLRGDVETIVGKALEKDVERRYESAAEMASDIRRHLADEPIRARPPSSLYQLGKFARRNKVLVGGVVAVVLALIAGLVGTSLGIVEARRSATIALEKGEEARRSALEARAREEEATLEAARANQLSGFLQRILGGIDPAFAQGVDTTLLERILAETATRIDTELAGQPSIEFDVRTLLGSVYFSLGKYPLAIAQYERARAILAPIAGERDPRVLRTRLSIAVVKHTLGRTGESYAELISLVDDVASALGEESELFDETRGELGVVLLDKSEHDRAAELFERSLAWRRAALGDDDEKSLVALNCLGLARVEQGRLEEADALMNEVLDRRERTNGPNHPETIKAIGNLGAFYDAHGKSADAERLARRAYEASLPVLGEEHPESLRYVLNLANALRSLHRYDEARPLFDRALEIERRVSGPEHPETLRAEAGLALLLRNVGRTLEAAELHGHVLEVKRRELGDSDPETLVAEIDLATDWMRAGRDTEAIALLERVVPSMSKALGERDDDTLVALHDLGAAYLGAGRAADAERVLRRALAMRMEVSGAEQQDTLICEGSLGLALQALEKDAEAIPHLAAMLVGWRRRYGDGDVAAQNAASEILRSARRVEDLGPLEAQLAPVIDHYRATNNRTQLACALVFQAESRAARAKWDECVPLLDEAVDLSTSAGGDGGPTAARAFGTLGAIKLARGKPDAAEPLLVQCWEALGESDLVAKRRAARALADVHAARGDASGASEWRERSSQ